MNRTTLLVSLLLTFGIPLAAILASTAAVVFVYAQQLSSSSLPAGSSHSTATVSPELKAKMCDPSNPGLKVVNTTESQLCGIAKTVKPPSFSATPPTSAVSSSSTPSTQISPSQTTKSAATTNNNTFSRSNDVATTATAITATPVGNLGNKSLLSSSSTSSIIAPQVNAVKQQEQPPVTVSNGTGGQNSILPTISPVVTADSLMYLGYHGDGSTANNLAGKSTVGTKSPSNHDSGSTTTIDNGSTYKGNSDTKSSSHDKDDNKSSSKMSTQSKDHHGHDSNASNKAKNKSSPKGHNNHRGGDSFFGGDPFF
jgi:hypothetical protein